MKSVTKIMILTIISLAFGSFSGCGKKSASVKPGRSMTAPNEEGADNLFLGDKMTVPISFGGQMLMWNEDVSAVDMANIIRLSTGMIQNGVKQLKYIEKNIYPLAAPFRDTLAKVKNKKFERLSISYEQKTRAAATWFIAPDGSGELVSSLTAVMSENPEDTATIPARVQNGAKHGMQVLLQYCEAKIWERAFKPEFVNEMYRGMRPTPSAMCEGVYQKFSLLDRSTEACSGSESYKNFFPCLLNEGVRKTSLWRKSYPEGSEVAKAFNELSTDTLQWVFGVKRKGRYLMKQAGRIRFEDPQSGKDWDIETANPANSGELNATQWVTAVEGRTDNNDNVRFIALEGLNADQIQVANEQNLKLKNVFRNFNLMKTGYYINENIFNRLLQKDSELKSAILVDVQSDHFQQAIQDLPKVFDEGDPRLVSLDQEISVLISEIKGIGAELKQRAQPLSDRVECPLEGSLFCEAKQLSKAGIAAIKPASVSLSSWYSHIEFEKSSNGELIYMTILPNLATATGKGIKLCAPLVDGAECSNPEGGKLEVNLNSGKVEAVISLSEAKKLGLNLGERDRLGSGSVSFSEIPEDQLARSNLKITAVLKELGGVLNTFIGDAKIIGSDNDEILYVGSIKTVDLKPELRVFAKSLMNEFCALDPSQCE